MTESSRPTNNSNDSDPENIHGATDPKKCRGMEKKYGWTLKEIRPNPDPILKVNCVFYGEQTSFQDMWGDYQD
ncbi:MAG: hypothetical protein SW833_01575 [Cyanobacteriota bacterium]|nr:hypothetical protein [Cyanobacteriota bacterium]